jgi:Cu(I)/Ag(I) efflux system protein CusF
MNMIVKAAFFALFAVTATANAGEMSHMHHSAPTEQQAVSATGVVKLIDMDAQKITIEHGPIAALNWPAMTMRFTLWGEGWGEGTVRCGRQD